MNKYRLSVSFDPIAMDTLSSSVSTLKVPPLHSTPRELFHFKAPFTYQQQALLLQHHSTHLSSTARLPNKTSSVTAKNPNHPLLASSSGASSPKPAPPNVHRKPASGYAAALLDKAQCGNSLERMRKDVKRVSTLLKKEQIQAILKDPFVGEKEKAQVIEKVVEIGKVNRFLAGVVRMMIERNKVGMVGEVLDEFERIYDELSGTRVVFVSSVRKMEENEMFDIAKRVQVLSGAVNVKVRNLVGDGAPSFAAVCN